MNKQALIRTIARSMERCEEKLPASVQTEAAQLIAQKIISWGMVSHWPEIKAELKRLTNLKTNTSDITITSAHELKTALRSSIEAQIQKETNKKLNTNYVVNPSLIGGVRAESDTWMMRASVHDLLQKF